MELISESAFSDCIRLPDIVFAENTHLNEIQGFDNCTSLSRITIPSTVELILESCFSGCTALTEVIFEGHSHLKEIRGFQDCRSLSDGHSSIP
jgi:hypothetical protein